MKAPPEVSPPPAIVAARDWLISQSYWRPLQPLIEELAKEPIWKQLAKRHPVNPVGLAALSKMRAWGGGALNGSDRDIATQMVFLQSVYIGNAEPETVTTAKYKEIAESYRAQAKRLRIEAERIEEACRRNWSAISFSPADTGSARTAQALRLIGHRRQAEEYVRMIERAASWCEAEASWMRSIASDPSDPDHPLLVERHEEPAYVRAYCIELAEITRRLYGDALYGMIASIATKVLNQTVTKARVRYWCEDKGP
jgi:hypothetical protein